MVMRFLEKVLGRRLETTGELGYFGLTGWWTSSFSAAEREHMEAAFCTAGLPAAAKPLTRDRGLVSFPTAAALLTVLADRLGEQPRDQVLAAKVLTEAERRARAENDVLGQHFVYHQMIRLYTRWKDHFANAADLIFAACHKQIQLAPEAARLLQEAHPGEPLPIHLGYQQASMQLEQDGAWQPALDLCKQAQAAGWNGNWSWRIQRLARKLFEQNPGVKAISSSGITWI